MLGVEQVEVLADIAAQSQQRVGGVFGACVAGAQDRLDTRPASRLPLVCPTRDQNIYQTHADPLIPQGEGFRHLARQGRALAIFATGDDPLKLFE